MVLNESQKTILITGANRGIGLKFVQKYTELGWNVIATARNVQSAIEVTN
jgi:NAD(P)-dependent dehydrogenase (short-subunit alcohol dehydrogenase family)